MEFFKIEEKNHYTRKIFKIFKTAEKRQILSLIIPVNSMSFIYLEW
jgi:hypothetical protein